MITLHDIHIRDAKKKPVRVCYNRDTESGRNWYVGYALEDGDDCITVGFTDNTGFYHTFRVAFGKVPPGQFLWTKNNLPPEFKAAKDLVREVFPDAVAKEPRSTEWKP